jgi:hypothetical protein
MESQYFIKKDKDGNYVIANNEGQKLFGLTCSVDDPCKNCNKCIKPLPIESPKPSVTSVMDKVKKALKNVSNTSSSMSTVKKVSIAIAVAICIAIFIFILSYYVFNSHHDRMETKRMNILNKLYPTTYNESTIGPESWE